MLIVTERRRAAARGTPSVKSICVNECTGNKAGIPRSAGIRSAYCPEPTSSALHGHNTLPVNGKADWHPPEAYWLGYRDNPSQRQLVRPSAACHGNERCGRYAVIVCVAGACGQGGRRGFH